MRRSFTGARRYEVAVFAALEGQGQLEVAARAQHEIELVAAGEQVTTGCEKIHTGVTKVGVARDHAGGTGLFHCPYRSRPASR